MMSSTHEGWVGWWSTTGGGGERENRGKQKKKMLAQDSECVALFLQKHYNEKTFTNTPQFSVSHSIFFFYCS